MAYAFKPVILIKIEELLAKISRNTEDYAKAPGKILAWAIAALLIFFVFFTVRFNGLADINAQDYAQIARHLSRGEGFTTSLIRPQSLTASPLVTQHPELTSPPLYIFILSEMFNRFGATDKVACLTSALFYLLSIPVFFFAAWRLFDIRAASLALALYITSAPLLDYSISGLPMSFLVFLFLLLLLSVYSLDGKSVIRSAAAGALVGACYLTQYAYIALYFPLVVHLFFLCETPRERVRHIVFATLACLVVIFPWICRNLAVTAQPFFTFDFLKPVFFSDSFPGNSVLRLAREVHYSPGLLAKTLVKKIHFGFNGQYQQVLFLPHNYLMAFFLVSIFTILQNIQTLILRRFVLFAGAVMVGILSLFYPGANILVPFIPFVIMAAADFFYTTISASYLVTSRKAKVVAITVFIIINVYPLATRIILGGASRTAYPKDRMEMIRNLVGEKEIVVTDIPWAVAWYCDRTAVWLPLTEIDYTIVKRTTGAINNIYLSPLLFEYPRAENVEIWKNIFLTRQVPRAIFLSKGTYLKEGGMFLSNEAKWEKYQQTETTNDGGTPGIE
jgi:4-amino-4-deoxy-L-arabinose transferase-like glycosyltransferase